MADCPHCKEDVTPEIVTCAHCEEYFVRFARVGRPRIYCSDACKDGARQERLLRSA